MRFKYLPKCYPLSPKTAAVKVILKLFFNLLKVPVMKLLLALFSLFK